MTENKVVRIGNESLILKKISYKVFRKINPRKKSKYLCYFSPGEGYFKFKRENSLPALKKQLKMFLEKNTVYLENDFVNDISFIPVYFYNNLLLFKDKSIPPDIKTWQLFFRTYLESGEIHTISFNLILGPVKGQKKNGLIGKGLDLLYYWFLQVILGKVKVKICSAEDCERIYIESKGDQKYCSEQCLQRSLKRRKRSQDKCL